MTQQKNCVDRSALENALGKALIAEGYHGVDAEKLVPDDDLDDPMEIATRWAFIGVPYFEGHRCSCVRGQGHRQDDAPVGASEIISGSRSPVRSVVPPESSGNPSTELRLVNRRRLRCTKLCQVRAMRAYFGTLQVLRALFYS
jgi:hypothetical protein